MDSSVSNIVKEYYGKTLQSKGDLKTSACCDSNGMPPHIKELLKMIHPEVKEKFYGCGSPLPPEIEGRTVLDLGCGTGRDCFLMSKLAGPKGRIIGVDMTDEQLETARRHVDYQARAFGFDEPNVTFIKGYIEDLQGIGIEDESVDVVVSNCVINLSPDKLSVFSEIFRALKPGGELFFSDVFADRRIPPKLSRDPVLLGECLGGALYTEDFRRMMAGVGCPDVRVLSKSALTLEDPEVAAKAGMINFHSITVRAFKLASMEDRCEDFGQVAVYLGTIPENPHSFALDDHHIFIAGKPMTVCGNTASMIQNTRYSRHFRISGDRSIHYGLFDCAPQTAGDSSGKPPGACC